MTTTLDVTTEKRLTIVKHLADGKSLDTTAALVRMPRTQVLDIASHHGYPSEHLLQKAVDLLGQKLERDGAVQDHPDPQSVSQSVARRPTVATVGTPQPLTRPDEIRVLLNTAKGHPSKRIQGQANRVIDAVDRLKSLLQEDEEKHAERRRQEEQKAAAKAEVQRLTRALAEARAKLRGSKPTPTTLAVDGSVTAADLRAWARENGVECPPVGRVPQAVREAYEAAHEDEAVS